MLLQIINEVARPSFFIEEVGREYFNLISNLVMQTPKIFASEIGTEYLAVFACSNSNAFGSSSSDKAYFEKIVKKTLLSFKQRD